MFKVKSYFFTLFICSTFLSQNTVCCKQLCNRLKKILCCCFGCCPKNSKVSNSKMLHHHVQINTSENISSDAEVNTVRPRRESSSLDEPACRIRNCFKRKASQYFDSDTNPKIYLASCLCDPKNLKDARQAIRYFKELKGYYIRNDIRSKESIKAVKKASEIINVLEDYVEKQASR